MPVRVRGNSASRSHLGHPRARPQAGRQNVERARKRRQRVGGDVDGPELEQDASQRQAVADEQQERIRHYRQVHENAFVSEETPNSNFETTVFLP